MTTTINHIEIIVWTHGFAGSALEPAELDDYNAFFSDVDSAADFLEHAEELAKFNGARAIINFTDGTSKTIEDPSVDEIAEFVGGSRSLTLVPRGT